MKETFRSYYRPTEQEFSELWRESLIIPDANVILNLYSYSQETRDALLGIFSQVSDRLWISHQAALEYQNRRLETITNQAKAYEVIEGDLEDAQKKLGNTFRTYSKHPSIHVEPLIEEVERTFSGIKTTLNRYKEGHPDLLNGDYIRDRISDLLDGKVGSAYTLERLEEIHKEGVTRYERNVPPGFKDKRKGGTDQFGDLVIWFQIIDQASATHKPIIFITDDDKEDWWQEFNGNKIGPRRELTEEIFSKSGVAFYMYPTDRFMECSQKYLRQIDAGEAIEEVRNIRKHNEMLSQQFEKTFQDLNHPISEGDYVRVRDNPSLGDLRSILRFIDKELKLWGCKVSEEDLNDLMYKYRISDEDLKRMKHNVSDEDLMYLTCKY